MCVCVVFCFQAEDGIRDLVRSRGLGDVYKRQGEKIKLSPLADNTLTVEQRIDAIKKLSQ